MKKLGMLLVAATAVNASAVTVEMKDETVLADVTPIGINFKGQSYYAPPKLKISYQENFEGTDYRQCHKGLLEKDGFTSLYGKRVAVEGWWRDMGLDENFFVGAKVTLLSGPAKGQTAVIKELTFQDYNPYRKGARSSLKFVFEEPIDLSEPINMAGVLIEIDRRDEGCTGQMIGHWMGPGASLTNDVSADGFGQSSLLLDAEQGKAFYRTPSCWQKFMDNNAKWIVTFKARAASKDATLVLEADPCASETIALDDEWKTYTVEFDISGFVSSDDEQNSMVVFVFSAPSGKVLIDDILTRREEAFQNPTVFRDDFVETMRALNPGILRHLIMGGAMRDYLELPNRSYRVSNALVSPVGPISRRRHLDYSLGELLELAEELDAEAWFGIPGTLYVEEMDLFMEYIGGPVTTEGGKLRAEQGHPEPWAQTLKKIYVEPGNECWNTQGPFLAGGYSGPDYWQDLFTRIKESPYYSSNVICMASGQNYNSSMSKQILTDTPAADRYAIAPYQVSGINATELEFWMDDDGVLDQQAFFRWALAYPFHSLKNPLPKQDRVSQITGTEFAVYECSWHMTGGDIRPKSKKHDPRLLELVNRFVSSTPAAVGHFNHLLSLMHDYQIRAQCHFTFDGTYHEVRLWGSVLNYKKGEERMRPTGLALSMINEAVFGDMVEAEVEDVPTFTATGLNIGGKWKKVGTTQNPSITAYAFKEGDRRSLILFNMDLTEAHSVELQIPKGGTAKTRLLAPENYDDNNEFENADPTVAIQDGTLQLKDDMEITLPPASIMTLVW